MKNLSTAAAAAEANPKKRSSDSAKFYDADENPDENSLKNLTRQALKNGSFVSICYPYKFAYCLMRFGYIPKSIAKYSTEGNKQLLRIPSVKEFMDYMKTDEGDWLWMRGEISFCSTFVLYGLVKDCVSQYLIAKNKAEKSIVEEYCESLYVTSASVFAAVVVTHPLALLSYRQIGQYVGKEDTYSTENESPASLTNEVFSNFRVSPIEFVHYLSETMSNMIKSLQACDKSLDFSSAAGLLAVFTKPGALPFLEGILARYVLTVIPSILADFSSRTWRYWLEYRVTCLPHPTKFLKATDKKTHFGWVRPTLEWCIDVSVYYWVAVALSPLEIASVTSSVYDSGNLPLFEREWMLGVNKYYEFYHMYQHSHIISSISDCLCPSFVATIHFSLVYVGEVGFKYHMISCYWEEELVEVHCYPKNNPIIIGSEPFTAAGNLFQRFVEMWNDGRLFRSASYYKSQLTPNIHQYVVL